MKELSDKIEKVIKNYDVYMDMDPVMIEETWAGEVLELLEEILNILKNKK